MKLSKSEQKRLRDEYGPWALVTGASSGIGREIAMQLGSAGVDLVLVARSEDKMEQLSLQIKSKSTVNVKLIKADLSTIQGNEKVIEETSGLEVGMVVASAGFGTSGRLVESNVQEELNMLQVNCASLLQLTHHFSSVFAKKGRGGIILLSSMVSFQGVPFAANYGATKAYVQSLAEGLAIEMKPYGVDVLAAAPGPVSTGFAKRANLQMDMTLSPEEVAIPILKALGRKSTVLPGFLTKFLVAGLRSVPRWGKIRIMSLVMGGMTKHQRLAS